MMVFNGGKNERFKEPKILSHNILNFVNEYSNRQIYGNFTAKSS